MHASRRQPEVPPDETHGSQRDGADDPGVRQHDRGGTLRSILKKPRARDRGDMASLSTSTTTTTTTNTHGPRHGLAESTPIAPATPSGRDYHSISPVQSRDPATVASRAEGAALQEGTAGSVERGAPQPRTGSAERRAEAAERREGGWRSKMWENWGSVELENKGSVARDHLALERTFLAWLRTSLSFASIGIAITQLFRLNASLQSDSSPSTTAAHTHSLKRLRHLGKPLGATFIGISILMLLIGFHRYFEAQHYVIRGKFPASRGSIVLVSVVAGGLIISSLVMILATSPAAFES